MRRDAKPAAGDQDRAATRPELAHGRADRVEAAGDVDGQIAVDLGVGHAEQILLADDRRVVMDGRQAAGDALGLGDAARSATGSVASARRRERYAVRRQPATSASRRTPSRPVSTTVQPSRPNLLGDREAMPGPAPIIIIDLDMG